MNIVIINIVHARDYPKLRVNLQTDVKTELLSIEVIFMARRKDSPQKVAMRGLMREYLKNRGVEDILIACVNGLNGFPQAIEAIYPETEVQQYIIHQIRNSTKFVSYRDIKKLMADLKLVYIALSEQTALNELELFKDKWDSKYPKIYKSWHDNWATLSTYFKYPEAVRRLIYTTNAIEGFNRQLRKVTKSKTVFPSDDSLLKMLYLASMDITKKWTGKRQDWGRIYSQLEIYFEERLS